MKEFKGKVAVITGAASGIGRMLPLQVADVVFDAIKKEQFYILPHPEWTEAIRLRTDKLLRMENPQSCSNGCETDSASHSPIRRCGSAKKKDQRRAIELSSLYPAASDEAVGYV